MKRFTKSGVSLFIALCVCFFVSSCGKNEQQETKKEAPKATETAKPAEPATIKIGIAGAHSGELASYGLPTINAVKLVVEEFNKKGGVLGKKIEIVAEDDVCKPEVATNTATKLATQKVVAVIGHICSGATKAALGIYKDSNIPCVSPSATNTDLTLSGDYPNFFRTIAHDAAQAQLQVKFSIDVLKVKKVAVLMIKVTTEKGLPFLRKNTLKKPVKLKSYYLKV